MVRLVKVSHLITVMLLATILGALVACTHRTDTVPSSKNISAVLNKELREEIATYSMWLVDKQYRFGGQMPETGFDCSGMVSFVYMKVAGIKLPHNAAMIAKEGKDVPRAQLATGDLVFFRINEKSFAHVGIYIGNDRFIHAPNSASKIKISSLSSPFYDASFQTARTFF